MKKSAFLIFILISALLLSSCGGNETAANMDFSGHSAQSVYISGTNQIAVAPDGYYCLNGLIGDDYLTYISKSSAKETYLCNKPECRHVSGSGAILPTCDAYLGSTLPRSIVYHDGYVYVLLYDKKTYDVTLVKISPDGTSHEEIMVIGQSPDQASFYDYVMIDDTTAFSVYNEPDYIGQEMTIQLEKLDLKKKEKSTVYTYTGMGASIVFLKVLQNSLFFTQVEDIEDNFVYHLMRYDIDTGRIEAVLDEEIGSYTIGDDGLIFYYVPKGGLYKYDMKSGAKELIREYDEDTVFALLAYDGEYVYLDNFINFLYYNSESEHKLYVCDLDGKTVNAIPSGDNFVEVCDKDYAFIMGSLSNVSAWNYIRKEDLTKPDASWSGMERR